MLLRILLIVLLATSLLSTSCHGKKKIGKPIKHGHNAPKNGNMRKKTQAIVDIQSFGAKGDGLSDDTQVINTFFQFLFFFLEKIYLQEGIKLHAFLL